jgi:Putative peptidoglycan binding domain
MKNKKIVLTAVVLSGTVGLGAQTIFAQTGSRPIENPTSEKQFEGKGTSSSGGMEQGTGTSPSQPRGGSQQGLESGSRPIERGASESQFEEKGEKGPGRAAKISEADVQNIKQALKAKGHNPGPMNGSMDNQTQQAIRDFQKANKLPVTGNVDKQTAAKLGVTIGSTGGSGVQTDRSSRPGSDSAAPRSGGSSSESGSKGKGATE